jgi:hypothetical protein
MKNSKWVVARLVTLLAAITVVKLQAQTLTADSGSDSASSSPEPIVMNTSDMATVKTLSDAELAAFISALDATPTISYDALPHPEAGTFYSLQHPDWPPLPCDTSLSAVWQMNGFYLLNDVYFDYSAAATRKTTMLSSSSTMMTMDSIDPTNPGDGGTNTYEPSYSYTAPDYGTNLWIAQLALTNGYLTAIASNTLAGVLYEVQTNTDIATTNWGTFAAFPFFYGSGDTNWTPLDDVLIDPTAPNIFFRLKSWGSSDGSGLPDWWQIQYFGTNGVDPNADPMGDGWSNVQKFENGMNPNVFYTPPAPQGVRALYNAGSASAYVSWQASPGNVTGYTVTSVYTPPSWEGSQQTQTFTVAANTTSLTDNSVLGSPDPWGEGNIPTTYSVTANYASGDSAASPPVPLEMASSVGVIVPGPQGAPVFVLSAVPANTAAIRLTQISIGALNWWDTNYYITNVVIPIGNFSNGMCALPNWTNTNNYDGYEWVGRIVDSNGNWGAASYVGAQAFTSVANNYPNYQMAPPFYDGRVELKQNLIFQLRAALIDRPFRFTAITTNGSELWLFHTAPTNCAYAGFYNTWAFSSPPEYETDLEPEQPFGENAFYRNFVFDESLLNTNGFLTTGINDYENGYWSFYVDGNEYLVDNYDLSVSTDWTNDLAPWKAYVAYQLSTPITSNTPAYLATNQTRWLASYPQDSAQQFQSDVGLSWSYDDNYNAYFTLTNNARNYYGLPILSATLAYQDQDEYGNPLGLATTVVAAGNSATSYGFWNPVNIYPETAQPQFQTVEYDFWTPNWTYNAALDTNFPPVLPGNPNFSPDIPSQQFFAAVGGQTQIAGYAKLAILNGYSGAYGYLGQYFDAAYKMTNGVATTNTTGVLSPYGNFFATEPGQAALVTMPDVDTGDRGTCAVYVVSAVIDRTQGSNMDVTFNGVDATSLANPANIWVNNNFDRGHTVDGNDFEQDDLSQAQVADLKVPAEQKVPDCQYVTNGYPAIPCTRDLEDYFRLWLPGVAAVMQAMPTNYSVRLTLSGDGQIRIFHAIESDGGTNYLFDETTASNQVANSASLYVGTLSSSSSLSLPSQTNFNEHFIICGTHTGSAQIDLQILDGYQNVVADAPLYLQINDIKQMYERWTVGDTPGVAPASMAVIATDGLQTNPPVPAFKYNAPTDTNTPYILLVHGWNMQTWEKNRYAETAYKRLYWQGYKGRFGFYRWPTGNGISDTLDAVFHARNYDNSEYQAWQSASGLTNLLTQLNAEYPGNVYLMAHSMGNVVAGEALRRASGQLVNTYIAMQGAVPAHCYDPNTTTRVIVPYLGLGYDDGTPNRYAQYYTDSSPSYFSASSGAGVYVNFFNTNDYALSAPLWQFNQNLKPDNATTPGYHYSSSSGFYKIIGAQTNSITYLSFPQDTYEIFAYCDEPRCYALGAQRDVGGVFKPGVTYQQVDLISVWPPDTSGGNYGAHRWHSAEFRSDSAQRWQFWNEVLNRMGLQ